jgi:small-conductance mechanosensitive channel
MIPLAAGATTGELVSSILLLVVTFVVAGIVNRLMERHGGGITRLLSSKLPAADETRMRVARRLIVAAIIFVGVMAALVKLPEVGSVARGLLASAGITALIIGFAARSVLANLVSGIIVALAQPVRIGDYVTIDEWEGTIEEVRLTYSYIRAEDNSRIVIPNEQLGSKVIRNFTIMDETSAAVVEFVVPVSAALGVVRREALDVAAAFSRGRSRERQPTLAVTELAADTVRLRLMIWQESKPDADRAAAGLRFALEERLRAVALGSGAGEPADPGTPADPGASSDPGAPSDLAKDTPPPGA